MEYLLRWLLALLLLWSGQAWAAYPSAMKLIGTLAPTVSTGNCGAAIACFYWTGLASYSYYQIECNNIYGTNAGDDIFVQVGESTGPTWKTSNYVWWQVYNAGPTATGIQGSTTPASNAGMELNGGLNTTAAGAWHLSGWFTGMISGNYTHFDFLSGANSAGVASQSNGGGYYTGDNNAVTAIRLVETHTGSIVTFPAAGSCSLWALSS
jgi:hypothetical protein